MPSSSAPDIQDPAAAIVKNRAIVSRYLKEVWNGRRFEVADELIAPHYDAGLSAKGPEGAKQLVRFFLASFPDFRVDVEDIFAERDRVAVRYSFSGTQQGPWMGLPPSRKPVKIMGVTLYRLSEERIAETWFSYDALGLLQQLGLTLP